MKIYKATKHAPWVHYKTIKATASPLGVTERKAVNVPADAYKIPEGMNHVEIRASSDEVGDAGTMYFYGARKGDDISLIGSIAITTGGQVSTNDYFYVHQMTLTDRWITEVMLADASGNNGMSRICFDASGYDLVFVVIQYSGTITWRADVSGF